MSCFFVTDIHGSIDRYRKLFQAMREEKPQALFLGGDLMPNLAYARESLDFGHEDFLNDYLANQFRRLKEELGEEYPSVFVILGNDDGMYPEWSVLAAAGENIWKYLHNRRLKVENYRFYGYSYIPPSPFQLKDWERYDVSRYVDVGAVSPEQGQRSVPVAENEVKYSTIKRDLEILSRGEEDFSHAVFLFHAPPYDTGLDRAALDGKMVDHVPLDVHVGSIAIRRFIEAKQPLLTLHGHIHESAQITGVWKEKLGETWMINAAHNGDELSLVKFELEAPGEAERVLL